MRWRNHAAAYLAILSTLVGVAPVAADDESGARHAFELSVGGGLGWLSDRPDALDFGLGGQLGGRVMVDLTDVRAEAWATLVDPERPDRFQLRADARVLFVTVHDFTWRRTDAGEVLRVLGGAGGEIELPDGAGELALDAGFAMVRVGAFDDVEASFDEAYGAYVGSTLRLHFGELRDELRVAVHAWTRPPSIGLGFSLDSLDDGFMAGVTASNRLYLQVLREGAVSLGPELQVQVETLPAGPVLRASLGLSGALGL